MPIRDDDPRPPYLQLADELRQRIEDGKYQPGDRLPTNRQLAETHHISTGTVKSAVRVLQDEGLVVAHQGRGVFVQDPHDTAPARPRRQDPVMAVLEEVREMLGEIDKRLDRLERSDAAHGIDAELDAPDLGPDPGPDPGPGPEL